MTETLDLDMYRPPEAHLDMPYQVLETAPARRPWLVFLRVLFARRASHE
jgi:hypothetical protein